MILCDFGCSKVLGPNGKYPKGEPVFYADLHSPPEMRYEEGKTIFNSKTVEEFDVRGDVWQLAFTF